MSELTGRELDAAVAAEVMDQEIFSRDWPVYFDTAHDTYDVAQEDWETKEPTRWGRQRDIVWKYRAFNIYGNEYSSLHRVPDYSTDEAAAFQVLDCWSWWRLTRKGDVYVCELEEGIREAAATAPEAICRAALAAVRTP